MINTKKELRTAWYNLINGISVDVYDESVPQDQSTHYVVIRSEGQTDASNKAYFGSQSVIIIDIVTVFQNMIDTSVADDIDGEISALILPVVGEHGLTVSGFQVSNVIRLNDIDLQEDDGTRKYYRKIIRFNHLINE